MKTASILKIHRFGKVGKILCRIFSIFLSVACTILLVLMFMCTTLPEDMSLDISGSLGYIINIGELNTALSKGSLIGSVLQPESIHVRLHPVDFALAFGLLLLGLLFILVPVFFAVALCRELENCESPFSPPLIQRLRTFAFSIIPLIFTGNLLKISPAVLARRETQLGIEVVPLLLVVVILALSQIFKYGAILQRESDETL